MFYQTGPSNRATGMMGLLCEVHCPVRSDCRALKCSWCNWRTEFWFCFISIDQKWNLNSHFSFLTDRHTHKKSTWPPGRLKSPTTSAFRPWIVYTADRPFPSPNHGPPAARSQNIFMMIHGFKVWSPEHERFKTKQNKKCPLKTNGHVIFQGRENAIELLFTEGGL